jgi:hypothetical protein
VPSKQNNMKTKLMQEALWERIQAFSLDAPDATFPFSKKLAKEENWSQAVTHQAIEEYKKFVYLCCISPTGASPCEVVDKVWHLHLTYTVNYWEHFCPEVLQRKLHHHPSKGGNEETDRHHNWYAETLQLYKETFSTDPPVSVWGTAQIVPDKKVPISWKKRLKLIALVISFFVGLSGCSDNMGGDAFRFILMIGAFIWLTTHNKNANQNGGCSGGCSGGDSGGDSGGGCGGCGGD